MKVTRESTPQTCHQRQQRAWPGWEFSADYLQSNTLCGWPTNNLRDSWVSDEHGYEVNCKSCLRIMKARAK